MTDLTAETIKNLHAPGYASNFVDRYTPHILFFNNNVSFVDIDNMDGWYVMLEGASTKIEYIADTVWNHPYFNRQSFTGDLQSSLTTHSDNEVRSYTFTFYVGYAFNQDEYPIVLRQPDGYLATWIVTDHADRDRINELKALMYGSSLLNEAQPGLGFVGKGLMITKSVFPYSTSTTTGLGLNNATFLDLVRQLYQYGIEIVPHGLTNSEVNLKRPDAAQRLNTMDEFSPKTWIDHGGIQTNLHNKGWMTNETDYYILDLLQAHGYKYDWTYVDLDALNLNMLWAPATPDEGFGFLQPTYMNNFVTVQKHPRASLFDLYEFNTHLGSGAYHTYQDVGGATSPTEINQLINNKGVAIIHSYMAAQDWLNYDYISVGNGHFNMSTWLSNNLENMRTKMYVDHKLLVTTVSNWMDYILGMDSVTIEPNLNKAGKFTITNAREVTGLSLWFRDNIKSALIDGYPTAMVDDRIWLPKLAVGTHTLEIQSVNDIAIVTVAPSTFRPYEGFPVEINVTIKNEGAFAETFNVVAKCNETLLGTEAVTNLAPDDSINLLFTWYTTAEPPGYYVITATADLVTGETDTADNTLASSTLWLKHPGDLNGDKSVNVYDAILLSTHFDSSVSEYPDADINGDALIDVLDALTLIMHWGEIVP